MPLPVRAAALVGRLAVAADDALRPALADLAEALRVEPDPAPGAVRLAAAAGLSPFEYDLLLLAGLPEEHEVLARLARWLHPAGESWFTTATAAVVLELDATGRRHLRRTLDGGALRRHRLLTARDGEPLPDRVLRLPPGLWSVLRGVDAWPATLHPVVLPALPAPRLEGLAAAVRPGVAMRLVVVTGGDRDDRELAALAAGTVQGPVVVPACELDVERTPAWAAHLMARGAVPVIMGVPAEAPLPAHPGPVVLAARAVAGLPTDDRPVVTVELPRPDLGEAVALWRELLPELNGAAPRLAGLLRVGRLGAERAVRDARALDGERLSVEQVVATVRGRTEVRLPAAVRLMRPRATLDAVVLPAEQRRLLHSVLDRVRGQVQVLHEWGFGAAARHAGGVKVLLSGPPGTGKTLAVEAVTAELGLDLLVVDLAALVSKWLGETEKNIAEVFDAAERCQAVLFFDEADAVFGRRTDGSDAQGRWANMETAYLLGRLERSEGLVALATNLRRNVDDAFVRRLDVILEFDEPDRAARELLWRLHLPDCAPYAPDVDPAALAALYEIPGGLIRNAALAAGFAAAACGLALDQTTLIRAVGDEYRKAGRSFPGVPRKRPRREEEAEVDARHDVPSAAGAGGGG